MFRMFRMFRAFRAFRVLRVLRVLRVFRIFHLFLMVFRCCGSFVVVVRSVLPCRYRATHVFSRPGGRKGATKELMAVLEELEKTHLSSSGTGVGATAEVQVLNTV